MNRDLIQTHLIKVPSDIKVLYSKKKKILTFSGPLTTKSLKLRTQIFLDPSKKTIYVSSFPFSKVSNIIKKQFNSLQKSVVSQIKYILIESSILLYKRLRIVGVGYRVNFYNDLLTFKLGHSHFIYIKNLSNITVNCVTKTKICIYGDSFKDVSQFAALIRDKKIPEPYKGKGILYENEKIQIKEGKKI